MSEISRLHDFVAKESLLVGLFNRTTVMYRANKTLFFCIKGLWGLIFNYGRGFTVKYL